MPPIFFFFLMPPIWTSLRCWYKSFANIYIHDWYLIPERKGCPMHERRVKSSRVQIIIVTKALIITDSLQWINIKDWKLSVVWLKCYNLNYEVINVNDLAENGLDDDDDDARAPPIRRTAQSAGRRHSATSVPRPPLIIIIIIISINIIIIITIFANIINTIIPINIIFTIIMVRSLPS